MHTSIEIGETVWLGQGPMEDLKVGFETFCERLKKIVKSFETYDIM